MMIIELELPPDVEARLREDAVNHDPEAVRKVLTGALEALVDAAVRAVLQDSADGVSDHAQELTDEEFDMLFDELVTLSPVLPALPDSAITRDAIYADHP